VAPSVTRVRLRVVPGATRSTVVGRHGQAWKIRVTAPADRGAANNAVLNVLSDALAVHRRDLTLVSGHTARDKIVEIDGLTPADAEARLESAHRKEPRR
jgi:uncharacterized protein